MNKRIFFSVITLLLTSVLVFAAGGSEGGAPATTPLSTAISAGVHHTPAVGRDDEELLFSEDFEAGMDGWETSDQTWISWHKSDLLGGQNDLLWWCGDTLSQYDGDPVGYDNAWQQYLETPRLDLSQAAAGLELKFDACWLLEDPRIKPPAAPYDGWDGFFVMASTDGGATFKVISPTAPAYTAKRIKSAEVYWGMPGPIPAWVFHSGEWADTNRAQRPNVQWVQCSFNMDQFAEQNNVVLRFILTSDGAVAAPFGNVYLQENSGVFIDNVTLQDGDGNIFLDNNADDDPFPGEFTAKVDPKYGGDFWTRTDVDAHESTWSMRCPDKHMGLLDALDSPPIDIPADYTAWYEYWVHCDLPDSVTQGSQSLNDYYMNYISDDNGATWVYKNHDYSRPLAGGNDWVHYTWNLPYGNRDLYINDYAGKTIKIRWLTISNRDTTVNGTGLWIDDFTITGVNQPQWDAAFDSLHIPYPTTVGYRLLGLSATLHNNGIEDFANLGARWGFVSPFENRSITVLPKPSVLSDSSKIILLSDLRDGINPGWTPAAGGAHKIYIGAKLDNDGKPANDSVAIDPTQVWPVGLYELGYDNRTASLAFQFNNGQGPATRFTPDTTILKTYSIAAAKFKFNGAQQGNASATLHIYADNAGAAGAEILSVPFVVPPDSCNPNTFTLHLEDKDKLHGLNGGFWFYIALGANAPRPQIIGDKRYWGDGHYFQWNGNAFAPFADGDLLMQALLVPTPDVKKDIGVICDAVDFGKVVMDSSFEQTFTLYSTGMGDVTITNVTSTDAAFVVDWQGEVTLKTGQEVSFPITFKPTAKGLIAASLDFETNDDAPPAVDLTGEGVEPQGVAEEETLPTGFGLSEPYPNPFNSTTRITFTTEIAGQATVTLFDLAGRRITTLFDGNTPAGQRTIILNADNLPAGVYLIRLESGDRTAIRKVVLMK